MPSYIYAPGTLDHKAMQCLAQAAARLPDSCTGPRRLAWPVHARAVAPTDVDMQHLVLVLRRGYIDNVCQAANDGVKVKGYYAWSLME